MQEERRRIAWLARLVTRRIDHAMRGRRVHVVGEALQHVADVDHDRVCVGGERHPLTLARLHFQPLRTGADQQRDQVDVLVRAGADVGDVAGGDRRVVDRTQDGIAVVGLVGEVAFRQADVQRERTEHARPQLIQRLVETVGVFAEPGDFLRPQVRRHHACMLRIAGDFAADVPELLEIEVLGVLGGLDAERRIAARTTAARDVVFALHVFRQCEEALEHVVGTVDQGLRDAVVADAGETPLAIGRSELGDESFAVAAVGRRGETTYV